MSGAKYGKSDTEQKRQKLLERIFGKSLKEREKHKSYHIMILTILGVLFLEAAAYMGWRLVKEPTGEAGAAAAPYEETGSVNIDTIDGRELGYYGNVRIQNDGTNGHQVKIRMEDAWMVGEG